MLFQLLIATFYSTNLFIQSPELSHAQLPYNQAHAVQSYVNKHPFNSLSPLDLEVFDYIIFSQLLNEKPWHIYFQKYLQGIMHLGYFLKDSTSTILVQPTMLTSDVYDLIPLVYTLQHRLHEGYGTICLLIHHLYLIPQSAETLLWLPIIFTFDGLAICISQLWPCLFANRNTVTNSELHEYSHRDFTVHIVLVI